MSVRMSNVITAHVKTVTVAVVVNIIGALPDITLLSLNKVMPDKS
jgi:hypothetical protein